MPASAQRETARWRQGEIVDNTGDKAQRTRDEPLLDGPQRLLAPAGLDQDHLLGCDTEACKARRIKLAELTAGMTRRTPQQCGTPTATLGNCQTTAHQQQHEGEGRPPIHRMVTALRR